MYILPTQSQIVIHKAVNDILGEIGNYVPSNTDAKLVDKFMDTLDFEMECLTDAYTSLKAIVLEWNKTNKGE